ncbi:MAG: hypothetical protein R3Y10_09120 [Ferrimonas sp.]
MTDAQPNPTEQGQEQAQQLLNTLMPLVDKLLREEGEFMPFAAAMTPAGDFVSVGVPIDEEEANPSEAMLADLQLVLREAAQQGEYQATAAVYDTGIVLDDKPESVPQDAIGIHLEHQQGFAMMVFVPYTLVKQQVQYGEMMAQPMDAIVFQTTPNKLQ